MKNTTIGITKTDYRRSRAWIGNELRLAKFMTKLSSRKMGVNVVVCGGSITMGHGLISHAGRYSNRLEYWMNANFPITVPNNNNTIKEEDPSAPQKKNNRNKNQQQPQHTVFTRAAHGADMCAMAKRMNIIFSKLGIDNGHGHPDLVILEFGVNDYQGQDHRINVDHKTDLFFDGFEQKAMCAEAVVHNLLTNYPNTAILFLEFSSAILTRKTAQLLHMGVAQHYQIPVISYSEVFMPSYYELLEKLAPYQYTKPIGDDSVLSFPHGCSNECHSEYVMEQFQNNGCTPSSLCAFAIHSDLYAMPKEMEQNKIAFIRNQCLKSSSNIPEGREPCYIPFFHHDNVHPSWIGHGIATDLIAHALSKIQKRICLAQKTKNTSRLSGGDDHTNDDLRLQQIFQDHVLPPKSITYLAGSTDELSTMTDFVLVLDTMDVFHHRNQLNAYNRSNDGGFEYFGDGFAERRGWISTSEEGNHFIEFKIDLPKDCYILYLSTLRSYEGMGTFTVTVKDLVTHKSYEIDYDGIWEPRISVPADIPLVPTSTTTTAAIKNGEQLDYTCSGKCLVTVRTHPKHPDRTGNKVKIMTLSSRQCRDSDFM